MDEILKKTAEDIVENAIACPDVVPPNNCKYIDLLQANMFYRKVLNSGNFRNIGVIKI